MKALGDRLRWFSRSGLRWAIPALLIIVFLWFIPQLQGMYFSQGVPVGERPALVNEYRRTLAQIIGGFGLLLGLYFTWRRVEISQNQQVTERFTRAIDQLGATDHKTGKPRREVRLGGIYALERIARDSPKRDHSTVMEVLTAYVRENTTQLFELEEALAEAKEAETKQDILVRAHHLRRLPVDIQAILDVLGRAQSQVPEVYRTQLDLHGANLREARLQGANLRGAKLQGTNLPNIDLRNANLQKSDLRNTILFGAWLFHADLREADLQEADFQYAHATGIDLRRANLGYADLRSAKLQNADLRSANLQGAVLGGVIDRGANLQGAVLTGANLQGANLLYCEELTQEQIEKTLGDQETRLPNALTAPESWYSDS